MPDEFAESRDIRGSARTRPEEVRFDVRIGRLAGEQHGVVARWQLVAMGAGTHAIDRRQQSGRLHRLHQGVYAVGHRVVSRPGWWMAAVLARGPDAVLSHWSAAALWGIRPNSREAVDVTVPRRSRTSSRIRCHLSYLPPDETTVEDGIPVTTVARTIFDLAAVSPEETVESALGEAEYLRLHDRVSLWDLLERHPRHRGAVAIRTCLTRRGQKDRNREPPPPDRIRSPLEERFLPFIDQNRLPRPRLNAWIEAGGEWHQVDCLWPASKQVVEMDGWAGHSTRRAFRDDRARDRRLRVAGYGVTRLTWDQLDDEPDQIAADLRGLLITPATPGRS
jgi:hypothetical protein